MNSKWWELLLPIFTVKNLAFKFCVGIQRANFAGFFIGFTKFLFTFASFYCIYPLTIIFIKAILFTFAGEWGCFQFVTLFRKMRECLKTIDLLSTINKNKKRKSTS
jgi:hypothetical protein